MSLEALEPLRLITKTELKKLLNDLRTNDNPSSIAGQYYLENYFNWLKKDDENDLLSKILIYIPIERVEEHSTFIVVDLSDVSFISQYIKYSINFQFFQQFYPNIIIPFTLQPNGTELIKCLKDTKFISWKSTIVLPTTMNKTNLEETKTIFEEKELKIISVDEFTFYTLPKELKLDFTIPSEVKVTELYESDAELLNNYWTYGTEQSLKGIKMLIKWNGGLGLRKLSTNELIGWILLNNHFAIGMLQVIETEMRKGYGELLVKMISMKFVKEQNLNPITCISNVNEKSKNLFKKLGFKPFDNVTYLIGNNLPVEA